MKFESFPQPQKKTEPTGVLERAKKAIKRPLIIAGAALLGFSNLNVKAQEVPNKIKEDTKIISVDSARAIVGAKFEEDSIVFNRLSAKYPGIFEEYLKDSEHGAGIYFFNRYYDDEGNTIDTPDEINDRIIKLGKEQKQFENPEEWAKKRLEYEKTPEYEKEVLARKSKSHSDIIENAQVQLTYPDLTPDDINQYKHDIEMSQKTLDHMKVNPKAFMEGEIHAYDQLLNRARFQYKSLGEQIKQQNENLQNVLNYINRHKL